MYPMFKAALYTTAKIWINLSVHLDEWIKMWYYMQNTICP